jgi:Caspase domain
MRRALRDFADKARGADIAVIYFAGHGLEVDGTNYVVPVDAVLERDADVDDEAIALNRILLAAEPATQLRLVILDACRDNPFAKKMKRTMSSRSLGRGLIGVEANKPNTFIAFAAKEGSTAADGDGKNSPFSAALLKHLTRPGLDIRKAFGFVRDDVMSATGNQQEPYTTNSLGGNDVALVPAPAPPPAASGNANAEIRHDYELAERVGTKEAWDSFVAANPSGFYTDLAKAQRNKLAAETARIAATEKARNAAEEQARLAAEGAKASEQAKAAAQSKAAEEARLAAEKKQADEAKRAAAEQAKSDRPAQQDIPRLLQSELRRVGCKTGEASGEWNASARRALSSFNDNAGTRFDVKLASLDALDAVRARTGRVCPLGCERGYRADGDRCVKVTCDSGYVLGSSGSCQKRPEPTPKITQRERRVPAAAGRGKCFVHNGASFCE